MSIYTLVSDGGCCALCLSPYLSGATQTSQDYSSCFIGNSVYGERHGLEYGAYGANTYNCSGNSFTLFPPFDSLHPPDSPGCAAFAQDCQSASVCGNTLVSGGYGLRIVGGNAQALVLNNNLGSATYRGIGYTAGVFPSGDYLSAAQVFSNKLSQGVSVHVQLQNTNSFGWFLRGNVYVNTNSSIVPPFLDPASAAVHFCN